ncbi:MAG TPA: zinc ABC transporter substrate-binding protein [Bacteroidales bacterium]|jgi:zinc transport system substrate-binding protein|nr:zinc ABC transporter solute-binding protein [Bacteroidales bacterium]HNR41618.1 zinc ABC transporter substrate-binding protein [Bacteroidales bacterium]HPM18645.1 zinc ABC transporter substrate-binding protein [Bacteroidales bacterium]HQG77622.1 zinc ABC transporter substrate-binding protein [Bacteroidales bacterium]
MRNIPAFILLLLAVSCGKRGTVQEEKTLTVSIGPFKYFVEAIAGNEYSVNVMVPPGSNPHIYEPYPDQISKLKKSAAYISNGFLGFEITWLDRFYEMNRKMKTLSLGDVIDPIKPEHRHEREHLEGADPHYWVSPECAFKIAHSVKDFIAGLNPGNRDLYEKRYEDLTARIKIIDSAMNELSSAPGRKEFIIYHPNLGYLARDYGFEEIPVEFEGKEPSPARMKYLIDRARNNGLKVIMVQKEYDTRNARAIASETGAEVIVIDPLSEDWYSFELKLIEVLKESFGQK